MRSIRERINGSKNRKIKKRGNIIITNEIKSETMLRGDKSFGIVTFNKVFFNMFGDIKKT